MYPYGEAFGDKMVLSRKAGLACLSLVLLVTIVSSSVCLMGQAQTVTGFTRADKFAIPDNNGSISFSRNGTYQAATLTNGAWVFQSLQAFYVRSVNVTISVNNCNMTISSIGTTGGVTSQRVTISYNVVGNGIQSFNFGSNLKGANWFVSLNRNTLVQNQGWSSKSDGTIIVTGTKSGDNITATYFFPTTDPSIQNQSFFQNHALIIGTSTAAVIACYFALIVRQINIHKQRAPLASKRVTENRNGK